MNRLIKASPLELMIGKVARQLNLMAVDNDDIEVNIEEIREQAAQNIESNANYDKSRFNKTNNIKEIDDLAIETKDN